ncbi:MAG: hypothetical protein ABI614_17635, partial [Planctomycetota bacterium]
WGHAVSADMVHWAQLPHAILPYDGGTIFSGTATVDQNNSLGVQQGNTKTLVAAFTSQLLMSTIRASPSRRIKTCRSNP